MRITLSPYTMATNCTDITDCNDGISELWDACDRYKAAGQKVPEYIYKRIEKLHAKRDKCSLKEHGMKYDEWLMSRFDKLEGASDGYIEAYKEALKKWLKYYNYKGDKRTTVYHILRDNADSAREFLWQTPDGLPNIMKIVGWYFDEDITDYDTMAERIFGGLQGTKKADSKADDFLMEIKISKNSLPNSSELQAATGSLRGFLRAARAFPHISGTATTPRVLTANLNKKIEPIKVFEEKIRNWDNEPITDSAFFVLYVLSKLPPKEISRFGSYYVVDEIGGYYRVRFSLTHNAKAPNFLTKPEPYKFGITFVSKNKGNSFVAHPDVFYKEHVYYTESVTSDILRNILQGIVNVLKGGYYTVPCNKELYSPTKEKYIEHFGENYEKVASNAPDQSAPLSGTNDNDNFKRWFSGSKVVDADGKPLVVYHGTPEEPFNTFRRDYAKAEDGFWFTDDFRQAYEYALEDDEIAPTDGGVFKCYLNMRNPIVLDAHGKTYLDMEREIYRATQDADHDGVIVKNIVDVKFNNSPNRRPVTTYFVKHPNQIKSATRNNGNFSPESDNILEGVSGTEIAAEPQPEPSQDEPQNASDTYRFAEKLEKLYADGEKLDWAKAKKMAEAFKIGSEQELMQACELAVVLSARRIAHNGQSIAQRFAALKDLYDQQVTVRPLDTQSKILQQYSTPCPLAFLLGEFVLPKNYNGQWGYFLEPSAGNGMLTIALPESRTVVNEIDDIRRKNLEAQGFLNVLNHDASAEVPSADAFIGVITNPPFGKLPDKEKIERRGWAINTLDYKMAVVALDRMDKDGRAAIIVGGKMWNSYWKPLSERSQKKVLFGQWKTFLGYLYAQYNVVDVVYINGDNIYRKQGTQYPIVAILIDGRHDYNEAVKPNYVFDPDRDVIIDTYDQLFDRLMPHLQPGEAADNDEIDASKIHFDPDGKTENADVDKIEKMAKELYYGDRLRLARAKAKALLLYTYAQSNTLRGKDTPKRGDVYTLPKSWARHDAWLSNDEKDAYDFYSVANVSGDKVSVINESLMVTSVYTLENFKKMGFKFHHHEDKYGTIGGVDGVDDECIERIENLHKAADTINKWVVQNKNGTFNIKLPQFVENEITQAIGRAVDVHKIDSKGIRHSIKNHGIKGKKVEPTDIPVRDEYYMLIPYIMVSPDFVEKGSADIVDRESVRFVKRLSNGDLIVVEKESLNDPNVFETVNMWGKLSDVVNVPKNPNIHVRNVPISTSDIAKIIQDAEMAIIKDKIK